MKTLALIFILSLIPAFVLSQVGPITIYSLYIDDDADQFSHDQSLGNGNHRIEAGETIRLIIKLKNTGTDTAKQVMGELLCDSAYVSFIDSVEEYKDIKPGGVVRPYHFFSGKGGFLFKIDQSCSTGKAIFTLNITTQNGGNFSEQFMLTIKGGVVGPFTIADFTIDDDTRNFAEDKSMGDGNSKIDPGETIGLDLRLQNNGDIPALNYSALLRVNYPGITIIDSVLTYSVINFGSARWQDDFDFGHQFHFSVATDISADSVNFGIILYDAENGAVDTLSLRLKIEEPGTVQLMIDEVWFDDDQEYYTNRRVIGNGNDIMEPRETIEATARLRNTGTGSALNVKAVLHNSSPHLALVDSVEEFGSISANDWDMPDGWGDDKSFIVRILNTAPTGEIVCPVEITTQNAGTFWDSLSIPINASNSPPPGAVIILTSPLDGEVSRDAIITVKGYVDDPQTSVFLNGDSIQCENGSFLGYWLNRRGKNHITVYGVNSKGVADSISIIVIGEKSYTSQDKVVFYLHGKAADKVPYEFLSEFPPYNTTSEISYYTSVPDSMEWVYPLDQDIEGDEYGYSLMLSTFSQTYYTCRFLIRRSGLEQVLATSHLDVFGSHRFEQTFGGVDPVTAIGDTLVFRMIWDKHAHFWLSEYTSDMFGGSLETSRIRVPWFKPTPVERYETTNTPKNYRLFQNYPNPFNPSTTIEFQLPQSSFVTLAVYNVRGQLIRTIVKQKMPAGSHSIIWDGKNESGERVGSGVYVYRIQAGDFQKTKKMLLIR